MEKTVIDKPSYDNFETPVLIICFNRPQYIEAQLEALRLVKPSTIYLACDGARIEHLNDAEKVNAVRRGYEKGIDWKCNLHTNFSNSNLGCSKGPIKAMTWFFSEVEKGIILEDDIIPNKDFFDFMRVMLNHYQSNNRLLLW